MRLLHLNNPAFKATPIDDELLLGIEERQESGIKRPKRSQHPEGGRAGHSKGKSAL